MARKPLKKTVTIILEVDLRALTRAELAESDMRPSDGGCGVWLEEVRPGDVARLIADILPTDEVQGEMWAGSMQFARITAARDIRALAGGVGQSQADGSGSTASQSPAPDDASVPPQDLPLIPNAQAVEG
jgi:hypothetical protein